MDPYAGIVIAVVVGFNGSMFSLLATELLGGVIVIPLVSLAILEEGMMRGLRKGF